MGRSESAEQRDARRAAMKVIGRLSRNLQEGVELGRDAGRAAMEEALEALGPVLDSATERAELEAALRQYSEVTGHSLFAPAYAENGRAPGALAGLAG